MKCEIYNIKGLNADNGYINPCFGIDAEIDIRKANCSEENRINICTQLAAISTGKNESSNPEKRYKALLIEGAYKTASRPLEFIPVVVDMYLNHCDCEDEVYGFNLVLKDGYVYSMLGQDYLNKIAKFSYVKCTGHEGKNEKYKLYTNMRCLLNAGIDYELIPYNTPEDVKDFYAFKLKVPMFTFNHIITHTQLSKVTKSDRVTNSNTNKLWLPDDFLERCSKENVSKKYSSLLTKGECILTKIQVSKDIEEISEFLQNQCSQKEVRDLLKELGYKKEIYQRAVMELRYKEFSIAGWNNKQGWKNFLAERGAEENWKNWVQEETAIVAKKIKEFIEEDKKQG